MSVHLSIMFVYCIQMAKDIVELLSQSSSPIILVFEPKHYNPNPNCKGNPFSGVLSKQGCENFYDF